MLWIFSKIISLILGVEILQKNKILQQRRIEYNRIRPKICRKIENK